MKHLPEFMAANIPNFIITARPVASGRAGSYFLYHVQRAGMGLYLRGDMHAGMLELQS
jgi:hypothetical protein